MLKPRDIVGDRFLQLDVVGARFDENTLDKIQVLVLIHHLRVWRPLHHLRLPLLLSLSLVASVVRILHSVDARKRLLDTHSDIVEPSTNSVLEFIKLS